MRSSSPGMFCLIIINIMTVITINIINCFYFGDVAPRLGSINGCLLCQQSEARPLNPPFHFRVSALVSLTRDYLVGVCDHFLPFFLRIVQFVARLFAHRVGHVTLVRKVIGHHVAELFLVARVFVFDGGRGSVEYSAVCDCDVLFGCEVQKMCKRLATIHETENMKC